MFNLAGCVRWQCAFALLVFLFVSVLPVDAQDATGRIIGVVTDPTGAVVPRAKVTVTNVATGAKSETTTKEDGSYQVLLLPIGAYTVGEGSWKGHLTTSQHSPFADPFVRPLFGGHEVSSGFSGTFADDSAEAFGTVLVGTRSLSFRATLKWLADA